MTVKIHNVTVDAGNAYAQSVWWTQVVGWEPDPDDPNEPRPHPLLDRPGRRVMTATNPMCHNDIPSWAGMRPGSQR